METKEKLTKIESVIREVCPELQELTFGCEVKFERTNQWYTFTCLGKSEDSYTYWKYKGGPARSNFTVSERDGWIHDEIIGHPIHLEHILRAMQQISDDDWNRHWVINRWGQFLNDSKPEIAGLPVVAVGATFDLTLPLYLQSDEFISWLYGVLVGE